MDFFDQSGWQESAAAAFVVLKPTLQCTPVKVVHLLCILRSAVLPINKIAGAQLFIAAQFRQQAVIDGLCGQTMKLRIIQCAIWHTADVHFQQPIIYHKITGKIPEQRVSPVQPLCVLQCGMQKFMCQNKAPFLWAQSGIRIDIDFCHMAGYRRNADAEPGNDSAVDN